MYQIVCGSTEQETLACGEEGFLNNLVKMFQLLALTVALGSRGAACCCPTDGQDQKPLRRLAKESSR